MKRRERQALYRCDKQGLIKLINDPKYRGNKEKQLDAVVEYIARHGMKGTQPKEDVFDLIYTARNEFVAQEAKEHMDSKYPIPYKDINGVNKLGNGRIKNFIDDPIKALKGEFTHLGNTLANEDVDDPDKEEYNENVINNLDISYKMINLTKDAGLVKYAGNPVRTDVTNRLMKKVPGNDIDEAMKKANGSNFISRFFRRPSKQYKNFEESLKLFKEPGKANSGDTADLEKRTTAYLKHIIPEFKYSKDMPKDRWLECLPKGKRGRAALAFNVLDSLNEHKEAKEYMNNVENAVAGFEFDDKLDEKRLQEEFQKEVAKEVNEDLIVDKGEKEPANKKVEKVKEDDIPEEKLDDSQELANN